jgi:hypothetical protein
MATNDPKVARTNHHRALRRWLNVAFGFTSTLLPGSAIYLMRRWVVSAVTREPGVTHTGDAMGMAATAAPRWWQHEQRTTEAA